MATCEHCGTELTTYNSAVRATAGQEHHPYMCRDALRARLTRAEDALQRIRIRIDQHEPKDEVDARFQSTLDDYAVAGLHTASTTTTATAHGAGKPLADDPGPDAAFHAIDGAKLYVRRWPHAVEVQAQGPVVTLPLDTAHRLAKWLLALTLLALAGCCEEPARAAQPPPQSWAEPACSTTPLVQCPCLVGQRLTLCDCPDGGEVTP
jgi:hypothetical protein